MDGLEVLVQVAQALDGVGDGRVLAQADELRGHDAARGVVLVAEELSDGALLLDAHQAQELLGLLVVELRDELGGVVGVHLGQHLGRVELGHVAHDLGGLVVVELGHGLCRLLVVELREHLAAQARVQLLDDVGDVGGVQLVERLVRDGQLDVGQVAVQQVHVVPRDDALGDVASEGVGHALCQRLDRRRQRAQDAAHADLGAQEAQLA